MKTFYSLLLLALCLVFRHSATAQDGTLDTSFDTDGISLAISDTALAATDRAFGIAMQSDGRLLVCGDAVNGVNGRFFLMRFNTNGSLDNTFGTNGVLRGFIGASTSTTGSVVRLLSSGKILLGGTTTVAGEQRWYVTRLNPDGSTDTTFGISGIRLIDFDAAATVSQQLTDMKVRSDGKICLSGNYSTNVNRIWALARLNEDGSFDNSFSSDGLYGIPSAIVSGSLNEIVLTPDQKILTTGRIAIAGAWYPGIIRITNNGLVDSTFSGDGVEWYTIPGLLASEAFGIEISPNRTITLAGTARSILAGNNNDNIFVLKVNKNGGLVNSFGTAGIASFDLVGSLQDQGFQLKILNDNKIVVAGANLRNSAASSRDLTVIRLNSNGTLDNTYGTLAGRTFVDGGSTQEDFGYNLFIRPNGKQVAVGQASANNKITAMVVQLNGTTAPLVVNSFVPEVKSIATTSVLANSVTLTCLTNPGALSTSTMFQIGTNSSFSTIVNSISVGTGSGLLDTTVTGTVIGLSPGTPYYARAISSNGNGNDTSATLSFLFNNILPNDSLALWLRSDVGITTTNGTLISGWNDLSPKANHVGIAPGISQPSLINNATNGFPTVRFDGTNDFLTSTKHLDVRNGPSIFIVAKNNLRKDVNAFLKISATHTEVNSHMDFFWQAGTSGNGNMVYAANRPSSGFGGLAKARIYANVGTLNSYYLASCVVPNNITASGYFNGDSLLNPTDNGTGVFLAQGTSLAQIGVLPAGSSFLNGDLTEMIVYNRPLTQAERIQVETYLASRYNLTLSYTPTASLDSFSNLTASSVAITATVTPKSLGTQYQFEVSTSPTFASVISSATASLPASGTASQVTGTVSGLTSGTLYYYRTKLTNLAGTFYSSNVGAFRHQTQIPTDGLRTWIRSDVGVETNNQKVSAIYDLAEPRRYTQNDTSLAPGLVASALNGQPVMRFDGSNDVLTGNKTLDLRTNFTTVVVFRNRVRKSYNGLFRVAPALTGESSNLEMFSDGTGTGNGLQFATINRGPSATAATLEVSSSGNPFSPGNFYVWVEQKSQSGPAAGLRLINNNAVAQTVGGNNQSIRTPSAINTPYVGVGYNGTGFPGNKYMDGDIAEVIAYNRVLTTTELSQVHVYLDQKYNLGLTVPEISVLSFTKTNSSTMSANFTIINKGLNGTYQVQYSTNNFVSFDTLPRVNYVTAGNAQNTYAQQIPAGLRYTVYQVRIIASNVGGVDTIVRDFMSPNVGFADTSVELWLRADGGHGLSTASSAPVAIWNNLRAGGQLMVEQSNVAKRPTLTPNSINGNPALSFNMMQGQGLVPEQFGAINLEQFTIASVFRSQNNTVSLVYEHSPDANTNTGGCYLNTSNGSTIHTRRGTTISGKNATINWANDNTYRIAVHRFNSTHAGHELFINGNLLGMSNVLSSNPPNQTSSGFYVGARNGNSNYFNGQIAEIIVFGNYFTGANLDSLHAYLAQRYNISIVTGLEQNELAEQALQLYPNPAKDVLTLSIGDPSFAHALIEVYSLDGRMVQQHRLEEAGMGSAHTLSLEGLNAGTYMIVMHTDKGTLRRKLIKE
jgi:uncharacterized delta-60 repeat protein